MELYFNFLDWFYSSGGETLIFWIKIFAGFFSIIFFAAIVYINVLFFRLRRPKKTALEAIEEIVEESFGKIPDSMKTDVSQKWQSVLDKAASPNPSDWKLAVIEADSITDDLLKRIGLQGETMGERLKQFDRSKLNSIDELWEAHKIRNLIAHDPNRPVSRQEIDKAIDGYEKSLDELDFIE
ncbi:MAG: hypothetical protein A3G49_02180 [Candidatus Sungbacteria bacterium RIFCSPLOWO2_12_FULL_41_11]|uniref:DUF4145 domain-containing protein n=1 Tax=Candidatus Sungbacteria bacterium RIFCSPLOWO2_12_FULL_41_11 TaxID=1802286 RepID=A0A1G2LNG4_9BACT|nr:MAG: hypothetical protein UV01_C0004G0026 [Parcubacteria group bacterium GW2011_GWA2_42_14]OGZ97866.1 MAG: hypothetical protein A3D41_01120 [Candidatus Sungbacteria bacterium RIFCSPHIGHO2_02_FULL_41_12b]OHA13150.1 MAG: hypothetical protein A3G49_02180 [Candidatus Sungbacteria bacterium RIFCSPLOWO2_12_FULL_41_11]